MDALELELSFSPRIVAGALFLFLLAVPAAEIASENVTMTTYFPAPSGVYSQLVTTGNTILAKDNGSVTIGKILTVGRFAGDIEASAALGGAVPNGSIYYSTGTAEFRGYVAGAWQKLGGNAGVAFGGFYQMGDNAGVNTPGCSGGPVGTSCGCESPNPLTGACTCPAGFTDAPLSRTCESAGCSPNWDQDHFCYLP